MTSGWDPGDVVKTPADYEIELLRTSVEKWRERAMVAEGQLRQRLENAHDLGAKDALLTIRGVIDEVLARYEDKTELYFRVLSVNPETYEASMEITFVGNVGQGAAGVDALAETTTAFGGEGCVVVSHAPYQCRSSQIWQCPPP